MKLAKAHGHDGADGGEEGSSGPVDGPAPAGLSDALKEMWTHATAGDFDQAAKCFMDAAELAEQEDGEPEPAPEGEE
jgi:hypothetical protein